LVVPTYSDVAIQTDLDCQRQLSRIQTRDQDRIDPVGPSPLSALLLPSRDIVLGAVQKVFATVLPKDTSKILLPLSLIRLHVEDRRGLMLLPEDFCQHFMGH